MRPFRGLFILSLAGVVGAQPAPAPLTLQQAMRAASERLPSVQAAQAALDGARAYARLTGSQPNPYLRLSATAGDPVEEANAIVVPFEIGGQPGLRQQAAEREAQARERDLANEKRLAALRTGTAYYNAWERQQTLLAARSRTALARQLEFSTRRRYQVGEISQNAHLRAELELTRALSEEVTAQAEAEQALGVLNLLLGQEPASPLHLEPNPADLPEPPVPADGNMPAPLDVPIPDPTSDHWSEAPRRDDGHTLATTGGRLVSPPPASPRETVSSAAGGAGNAPTVRVAAPGVDWQAQLRDLQQASAQLPEVDALRFEAQSLRSQIDLARRAMRPGLQLQLYRNRIFNASEQGIQLAVTIPLWDWGQVEADVLRREGLARAAELRVTDRELAVRQRVLEAYKRYQGARARREILRGQVSRYAKLASDARRAYDANLMTLLEVFDVQQAYRLAVQTLITAEADTARAALELGALSPSGFFEEVTRVP